MPRSLGESSNTSTNRPSWIVAPARAIEPPFAADHAAGAIPLQQAWRGSLERNFRPGWARAHWEPAALHFDILFMGGGARNKARSLNERTWTLGAIAEIFLMQPDLGCYIELHITPENQRLQLRWPVGAIAEMQSGKRPLSDFLVWDEAWVQSSSCVTEKDWQVSVTIPVSVVDPRRGARFHAGTTLLANVSRYDYPVGPEPILSATAPLREAFYHRWEDWHQMALAVNHGSSGSSSTRRK